MGLDMYLEKQTYLGLNYEHNKAARDGVSMGAHQVKIERITSVCERVAYWRKANAIHAWFVRELAGGVDECQSIPVSLDQLRTLRGLCVDVLADRKRAGDLLPPQSGFFFGSTDLDEWYFAYLQDTIDQIEAVEKEGDADYIYRASW